MSSLLVALGLLAGSADELDEARALLRQGRLTQAEERLQPLAGERSDGKRRAAVLLLLGNVDYERGLYVRAVERYTAAEGEEGIEPAVADAARSNRRMAVERLERRREVEAIAARLGWVLIASIACAAGLAALLGRQSRPQSGRRPG